jgi:uncharacterized protein
MDDQYSKSCTAFCGGHRLASSELMQVATKVKEAIDRGESELILIFDDLNGEIIEVDFRGTINDVLKRLEKPPIKGDSFEVSAIKDSNAPRGPGRPKLGVVSREVTLLPRHWDWLNSQPGGASVALRKLVDEARHVKSDRDKVRHSQEAAYRFMSALAGNLPGYEEAIRALFAGNRERFEGSIASWPIDIREYSAKLSKVALQGKTLAKIV